MKLTLHFDGGSRGNPGPAGAGVVLHDAEGRALVEVGFYLGRMTNNMAEYHGLLNGLDAALRLGAREIAIFADSELVVRQLNGDYRVRDAKLRELFDAVLQRLKQVERWTARHIPREQNSRADELANMAMDAEKDVDVGRGGLAIAQREAGSSREAAPSTGRSPRRAPEAPSNEDEVAHARCTRPPGADVCPAPCGQGAVFTFDQVVPAGICLGVAAQMLRAVEMARKSGKTTKVYCQHEDCGACFEVRAGPPLC
jgi:ribonuclease HI